MARAACWPWGHPRQTTARVAALKLVKGHKEYLPDTCRARRQHYSEASPPGDTLAAPTVAVVPSLIVLSDSPASTTLPRPQPFTQRSRSLGPLKVACVIAGLVQLISARTENHVRKHPTPPLPLCTRGADSTTSLQTQRLVGNTPTLPGLQSHRHRPLKATTADQRWAHHAFKRVRVHALAFSALHDS